MRVELFSARTAAARWTDYLSVGNARVGMRITNIAAATVSTRYFHTDHLGSVSGGNLSQVLRAGLIAGATAFAFFEVGELTGHTPGTPAYAENVAGHALVGCASSAASGGSCESGALSGAITAGAGPLINGQNQVASLVANATLGGVASVAGGGKFVNGAITGAFGYLFNNQAGKAYGHVVGAIVGGLITGPEDVPLEVAFSALGGKIGDWLTGPDPLTYVIGRLPDTARYLDTPGYSVLNLPQGEWSLEKNDAWVQNIIKEQATVLVASPITQETLWDSINDRPTVFARELQQLQAAGYTLHYNYAKSPQ